MNKTICGDCIETMGQLPAGSIDLWPPHVRQKYDLVIAALAA